MLRTDGRTDIFIVHNKTFLSGGATVGYGSLCKFNTPRRSPIGHPLKNVLPCNSTFFL